MLFQSCQTATKSFLLQNSLMGVGMGVGPYNVILYKISRSYQGAPI